MPLYIIGFRVSDDKKMKLKNKYCTGTSGNYEKVEIGIFKVWSNSWLAGEWNWCGSMMGRGSFVYFIMFF